MKVRTLLLKSENNYSDGKAGVLISTRKLDVRQRASDIQTENAKRMEQFTFLQVLYLILAFTFKETIKTLNVKLRKGRKGIFVFDLV